MTTIAIEIEINGHKYHVKPTRVHDSGPLVVVPQVYCYYKENIVGQYFSLKSTETGKYLRSAGGNNITAERDKVGNDEQFLEKDHKTHCTTGGKKDLWYLQDHAVKHYKNKNAQSNFRLVPIEDLLDVHRIEAK